jgi:hypothetical protein
VLLVRDRMAAAAGDHHSVHRKRCDEGDRQPDALSTISMTAIETLSAASATRAA